MQSSGSTGIVVTRGSSVCTVQEAGCTGEINVCVHVPGGAPWPRPARGVPSSPLTTCTVSSGRLPLESPQFTEPPTRTRTTRLRAMWATPLASDSGASARSRVREILILVFPLVLIWAPGASPGGRRGGLARCRRRPPSGASVGGGG